MTFENKRDDVQKTLVHPKTICCRKISVFACACGVFSLILHINSYIYNSLNEDNRRIETDFIKLNEFLNVEVDKRIDAYVSSLKEIHSVRLKRDAMVVSTTLLILRNLPNKNIQTRKKYQTFKIYHEL